MNGSSTRRELLMKSTIAAGSALVGGFVGSHVRADERQTPEQPKPEPTPWEYHPVSPDQVAQRAYEMYPDGACMYAVTGALLGAIADEYGEPYASFPVSMMRYGHGGVSGWGAICGSLNGSAAMVGLFVDDRDEQELLIDEILSWYRDTKLPQFRPSAAAADLIAAKSDSIQCHVSSST